MVTTLLKLMRSAINLLWLLFRCLFQSSRSLLAGDWERTAEQARIAAIAVHDDALQAMVALQRLIPRWGRSVPGPDIDRILIVKLDRIGDMVTTTPVIDALRTLFPRARLDIIGHPLPLTLFEDDTRIAERIHYETWLYHPRPVRPPSPGSLWLVLRLILRRYPLVIYLRGSGPFLLLGLTSRLAAAKFVESEPVIDRYLKAIEQIYGPVAGPRLPRLHIGEWARQAERGLRQANSLSGPRIVVHPAASNPTKVWPSERFAALADRLHQECSAEIHFLGSPSERQHLKRITDQAIHTHTMHCDLRLPESAAVIEAADLFIGNDSGMAHIAAAVETPMVLLWGPVNLRMARPAVPPERCTILYHDLPCRATCPETRCDNPSHLECLTRTQVDHVVAAAKKMLAMTQTEAKAYSAEVCVARGEAI